MRTDQTFIKNEVNKILQEFKNYCQERNISFYLGYGTLLGAIRHQGFIPWDDDIDIILLNSEYNKLVKYAKTNRYIDKNNRYKIMLPQDENYCYPFIKIIDTNYLVNQKNIDSKYRLGFWIDVFRLDYWPRSSIQEFFELKTHRLFVRLNEICIRGNLVEKKWKIIDKILTPIDVLFDIFHINTYTFTSLMERQGIRNKKSDYVGNIMFNCYGKNEKIPLSLFKDKCEVIFEGEKYFVPKNYDYYLKSLYGNYMKLPDESKRIGHGYEWRKAD